MKNLEEVLRSAGNPVDMLRNSQIGAYVYPVVPAEFSNWRDEQRAWRETAVLFDQSHHMVELYVEGPDALKLFSHLGDQQLRQLPGQPAKQFVPSQLRRLRHRRRHPVPPRARTSCVFVGRAPTANWIQFHAETGGFNVEDRRKDDRSPAQPEGQGGHAPTLPLPDPGPERLEGDREAERRPAARHQVLQHGHHQRSPAARCARCATAWPARRASRSGARTTSARRSATAIVEAGKEFGLVQVGSRAYATNTLESGWIPSPLPAVYTGEKMKKYREWLPADELRGAPARSAAASSRTTSRTTTSTPYELGYGPFVKFDHDFIGREALEKIAEQAAAQEGDVRVERRRRQQGLRARCSSRAQTTTSTSTCRSPTTRRRRTTRSCDDGKIVGLSMFSGYSYNERSMLSLGIVDADIDDRHRSDAGLGRGERRHARRPTVERHKQIEIRAIVSPVPYAKQAQTTYHEGWRSKTTA